MRYLALVGLLLLPLVAHAQTQPILQPQQQAPSQPSPEVQAVASGLTALLNEVKTVTAASEVLDNAYLREIGRREETARKLTEYWDSYDQGSRRKDAYWRAWIGLPKAELPRPSPGQQDPRMTLPLPHKP